MEDLKKIHIILHFDPLAQLLQDMILRLLFLNYFNPEKNAGSKTMVDEALNCC